MQMTSHPDLFARLEDGQANERQAQLAAQQSMWINRAYQTLLRPLSRAQYILQLLTGKNASDDKEGEVTRQFGGEMTAFVMDVMEMQSQIEDDGYSDDVERDIDAKLKVVDQ